MRIGELATRAGVSTRALRYYEERGLLESERSSAGQRQYAEEAVERVQLIQQLFAANLSSRTIAGLMPCVDGDLSPAEAQARLTRERDQIDAQIAELTAARGRLTAVIALCAKEYGRPVT
ncbi:MerR family transcriptional regulator [Kribbella sandramycini]|uniref:DNA-binding transcriptional MerR regulator n=1 Tax=Kribbella sandramycini TaxID=60450 RepID=A0A7Y4NXS9_9ACTN|nr:DNA-binding transcriptional MerR regulator [Kribbella sandramycini]NOL40202.1 MerR family transcriptional regulator [Kribbella sandramycini]